MVFEGQSAFPPLNQSQRFQRNRYAIIPYGQSDNGSTLFDLFKRVPKRHESIDHICHGKIVLGIAEGERLPLAPSQIIENQLYGAPLVAAKQREFHDVMGEITSLVATSCKREECRHVRILAIVNAEFCQRQPFGPTHERLNGMRDWENRKPWGVEGRIEAEQTLITLEFGIDAQAAQLAHRGKQQINVDVHVS